MLIQPFTSFIFSDRDLDKGDSYAVFWAEMPYDIVFERVQGTCGDQSFNYQIV